jgi:phospholipase/lecithinase/hemolysin
MKFKGDGMRAAALRALGALLSAAVLASCGGGQQVERFVPTRVVAFGDENSVIDATSHKKWTVNYQADANTAVDCKLNPIWTQVLATAYALVFPECNTAATPVVSPLSRIKAEAGARSAAVQTQIDSFLLSADGGFAGKDLVTILAGQNDILDQYALVTAGSSTEAQAVAVLEQAGTALAGQVNRVGTAGGKVLISTVPDMGLTPFAIAQGTTNAALLTRLTARFNAKLRVGLINDGHMIGLLLTDELVQALVKAKASITNVTDAACAATAALPDCSTLTLSTLVTPTQATPPTASTLGAWLWADSPRAGTLEGTHLTPAGHAQLGSLALSRAQNNPF